MLNTPQTERRSAGCDRKVVLQWIMSALGGAAQCCLLELTGQASEAGLESRMTVGDTPTPNIHNRTMLYSAQ